MLEFEYLRGNLFTAPSEEFPPTGRSQGFQASSHSEFHESQHEAENGKLSLHPISTNWSDSMRKIIGISRPCFLVVYSTKSESSFSTTCMTSVLSAKNESMFRGFMAWLMFCILDKRLVSIFGHFITLFISV